MNSGRVKIAHGQQSGFSLIEVLVATVALLLLVVLLGSVLQQVGTAWVSGESQTRSRDSGRSIAEIIARELEGALAPLDPSDMSGLQWVLNPSGVPDAYKHPDAFFWQTPLATRRDYGDIAETGYFIRWDQSTGRPRAALCRFFVNPAVPDPDDPELVVPNAHFLIYEEPNDWLSEVILDAVAPANQANDYRGLLAENVIGLWVTCLDRDGIPIPNASSGGSFDSRVGYTKDGVKRPLPAMVEVSFVIIAPRTAERIDLSLQAVIMAEVGKAGNANEFVEQAFVNGKMVPIQSGLRAYSKRINLLNAQ